ncbi:hypothetical protein [Duncaniella muris]|uniref:hypothetical protein n=1 Tax=Duncaniella muris TaxID=2094150 RepID=UPI00272B86BA|nr:hypothetical protein [Duncaniella muris]
MAVTTDEILARGKGPVQTTWADEATQPTVPVKPVQPQPPVATDEPTGVESVSYDTTTAQGEPNNPKNAREVVERGVVNVANPQTATDTEQVTPVDEQQTAPEGKKLSYVEMFQQMSPYKPPTPEELEKERKKQKREAIFAAIGEGISAMSNLYFTTQYAPNAFAPSKGMAATTKARFDQLKKDREQNQREYMEGFMRAMRWDAEDARDERNWNHTIEREKVTDHYKEAADARAQAKADRDAAMAQLRMDLMQGKINQQEAAAEAKRIEADYAEAYWQSRINKNNYRRPIGSGGRGGGGKAPEYPWYDRDGNLHYASSYEAMRQNALNHGTWSEATQEVVTEREQKDRRGNTKSTTSSNTTKPAKGHSEKPQQQEPPKEKKKTNVKWK